MDCSNASSLVRMRLHLSAEPKWAVSGPFHLARRLQSVQRGLASLSEMAPSLMVSNSPIWFPLRVSARPQLVEVAARVIRLLLLLFRLPHPLLHLLSPPLLLPHPVLLQLTVMVRLHRSPPP